MQEASFADLGEQMRSISQAESQAAAARARVVAEYTRRLGQKAAEKPCGNSPGSPLAGHEQRSKSPTD